MARQIRDASETVRMLSDDLVFGTFASLRGNPDPDAARLLSEVRPVLEADRLAQDLAPRLRELALRAHGVLRPGTPPPSPPPPAHTVIDQNSGEGVDALESDITRIKKALSSPDTTLVFEWKVVRTKP
jgi:hypothetical protein